MAPVALAAARGLLRRGKRFLSSRSAQMEPGQLRGSQSPPPPPPPPVSWSWSGDKEPGTGRWEPPRSPGTGRCQRGEHSQLLLLISTLDPSRILPLLTPRLWASFPSYCWIREWSVAGSLPSAHPTRPGRGEILPVEFSPWIFTFSPQKCRWFRAIAPHADIFGVRPHETSPAFLWVLFPHSCFSCTTALPSGTIPASQGGHPCLSSPGHPTGNVSTAGTQRDRLCRLAERALCSPLPGAAAPLPAHSKSPFHFFSLGIQSLQPSPAPRRSRSAWGRL